MRWQSVLLLLISLSIIFTTETSTAQHKQSQWLPYIDTGGQLNTNSDALGQGNWFLPIWDDSHSMIFADLRGLWNDHSAAEGNWGIGYREIVDETVYGIYGFYDLRHSENNINYNQITLGFEVLAINWGMRINGYIPEDNSQIVSTDAFLRGNQIVVSSNRETAYYGADLEGEMILWRHQRLSHMPDHTSNPITDLDAELWASAGVFYFDAYESGFEEIFGPRIRAELRLYDLGLLGDGSRLVIGGQYEYDEVRGNTTTALLSVRIPLQAIVNAVTDKPTLVDRRMMTPIVRDVNVITANISREEAAVNPLTGDQISNVVTVNSNTADVPNTVTTAGNNSLVIANGDSGTINTTNVQLQNGQVLLGGGSSITVTGAESGLPATFTAPGSRPTLTGTSALQPVVVIANNAAIIGTNLTGGSDTIQGNNVTSFLISNNTVSGAADNGVELNGNVSGDIIGNTFTNNTDEGVNIATFNGGTISENTSSRNGQRGFLINVMNGGTIRGNTTTGNTITGITFTNFNGGTMSGNTSSGNGFNGFTVRNFTGGTITGNVASLNDDDGFEVGSALNGILFGSWTGGAFTNNTSTGNNDFGFRVNNRTGGTASGNTATNNGDNTLP